MYGPELNLKGDLYVWYEVGHAVLEYRLCRDPKTGIIEVRDLYNGKSLTWQDIWPYPGDQIVFPSLDCFQRGCHTDDMGWTVTHVLTTAFGVTDAEIQASI